MANQQRIEALSAVAVKPRFNNSVPRLAILGALLVVATAGGQTSLSTATDGTVAVAGSQTTTVGRARKTSVAEDDTLKVGKHLVIEAGDSITIQTGGPASP